EPEQSVRFACAIDGDDIRMSKSSDAACFLEKAIANEIARGDVGLDDLDRDGTIERFVAAKVDGAHPALTQQAVDGVLPRDRRANCFEVFSGGIDSGHVGRS